MKIEGIPESITRDDYLRLVASTGLDVTVIRALEFRMNGIYVTVKSRRPGETHDYLTTDGYDNDELAVHRIFIPVVN